jgi:hypothetical protein
MLWSSIITWLINNIAQAMREVHAPLAPTLKPICRVRGDHPPMPLAEAGERVQAAGGPEPGSGTVEPLNAFRAAG